MDINDFRYIVIKEDPCEEGLRWLENWISRHPHGTTTQFFRWAMSNEGIREAAEGDGCCRKNCNQHAKDYLSWVFCMCLDWSEEAEAERARGYGWMPLMHPEYILAKWMGHDRWHNNTLKDYGEALIRAFED